MKFQNDPVFRSFAAHHKTFILLDVGGSKEMIERIGELREFVGPRYAIFQEPDLGNQVTCVSFIVPQSVYDIRVPIVRNVETAEEAEKAMTVPPTYTESFAIWLKQFRLASGG